MSEERFMSHRWREVRYRFYGFFQGTSYDHHPCVTLVVEDVATGQVRAVIFDRSEQENWSFETPKQPQTKEDE